MIKSFFSRSMLVVVLSASCLALSACGGGGGGGGSGLSTPGATSGSPNTSNQAGSSGATSPSGGVAQSTSLNQVPVTVEQNPAVSTYVTTNMPYVTVTVCDAANNCSTIDHVLLDTMSSGLRLFAGSVGVSLPTPTGASPNAETECADFMSGYMFGSVRMATVKMAGEVATNVPVQLVADPNVTATDPCSGSGLQNYSSPTVLGANGILGVAVFTSDNQQYFTCTSGTCIQELPAQYVGNPVAQFATDNNGLVLSFPAQSGLSSTASGTLTFGVDTQSDNQSSSFSMLQTQANGDVQAVFNGGTYADSFVDSGSNMYALYMPGMPTTSPYGVAFLNPASASTYPVTLNAAVGAGSYSSSVTLVPASTYDYSSSAADPYMATPLSTSTMQDFGLPFFYGKSVALVFGGKAYASGAGPMIGLQ